MEKKTAKKLLIRTIIVVIIIIIVQWILGNYVHPFVIKTNSLFGIVLYGLLGAFLLFVLLVCYQFAREYIYTIRKND